MFYIVGLGNPGTQYAKTRHNIGWWVCDALVAAWQLPTPRLIKKCQARLSEGMYGVVPVTVCYPETFMNNSGHAVRALVPKDAYGELIVVYDDVDLPVGTYKISYGNGAGGHNGVASVIASLGTKDFVRVRVGVSARQGDTAVAQRPLGDELAAYVLSTPAAAERVVYEALFPRVVEAIETIITAGRAAAMHRHNTTAAATVPRDN